MSENNTYSPPSSELWSSLYSAANRFYSLAPWKLFSNEVIFGVEDPVSTQIGWCSVMGEAEIEFGLCMYRGGRGFKALIGMLNEIDYDNLLPLLDSVNLTFDHSDFLDSKDLAVISELGLSSKYKRTRKWPRFRSYLPARYPWFLNTGEALFLMNGINQAIEATRLMEKDPLIFVKHTPERFLVRVQRNTEKGTEWFNEYKTPEVFIEPQNKKFKLKQSTIQKIRSLPVDSTVIFEADLFILNTPIMDSEPPWLPWLMLMLDVKSDYVFPPKNIMKDFDPVLESTQHLISILQNLNYRPGKIRIKQDRWHHYLSGYCTDLGVELEKVSSLPAISNVKQKLQEHMSWDKQLLDNH